jgi:hypothetical protein
MTPPLTAMGRTLSRPVLLAGALIILAAVAGVVVIRTRPRSTSAPHTVEVAVGEEVRLDPGARRGLRVAAVAEAPDGGVSVALEPEPPGGEPLRLLPGQVLEAGGRKLTLLGVAADTTRGAAVQLQWVPAGGGPRPIFTVGAEPEALPGAAGSAGIAPGGDDAPGAIWTVAVEGDVPPPGSALPVTVAVLADSGVVARGPIDPGGSLLVGTRGALRRLGTVERLVARIRVE